jgi:hypothetical protein
MTFSSIASEHANEYVTVTHRVTGLAQEKLLSVLISEASEKQSFADADLDESTITVRDLCDFLCDYNISLS